VTVIEALPRTRKEAILLGGRYRLAERLGRTGGIPVWQATDEILRRPVIAHLLPGWIPVRPGVAAAVQAGARMNDPRIATVFDADYSAERPYIVSEWTGDPDLEQLLRTGLPDPALAALIVADAAAVIAAAHEAGRPHLCLRPRSLHWGGGGIKVTGLGIDAALCGADASSPAITDTTDLARILYALLTGYWPGDGETTLPAAPRSPAGFPEPRRIRPEIPSILNAITCHALHGQPSWGRPSIFTPAELAATLRSAQRSMGIMATGATPPRARR
jgi:eukaryotic-like serine/threonine-protein kinase